MTPSARGPSGGPKVAAFFDVDNTIIRGASAFHIARALHRHGYLRSRDIFAFGWQTLKYTLFGESKKSLDKVRDDALSIIRGINVAEMASIGEEVYDQVLALRIFPGTKKILDNHLRRGHEVWLVTASPVEVGRIIAKRLRATGALGTVAEREKGVYTGRLVGDMLHGKKKAKAAVQLAEERGLDLENSFAYGDSMNDEYILKAVGNPCAINPEPRLRRLAKRQGWPIQDFRGKRGNGRRSLAARTATGTLLVISLVWRALWAPVRGLVRGLFQLGRGKSQPPTL